MLRIYTILLAAMLAAPAGLRGQQMPTQSHAGADGPVTMLLQLKDRLRLTDEQVTALREIEAEMDRLNRPLLARISEIRRKIKSLGPVDSLTVEQRAAFDSYMAELRPVVEQIQQNNLSAMRRVGDVLTDRQRERLRRILRDMNGEDRERSGNIRGSAGPGD